MVWLIKTSNWMTTRYYYELITHALERTIGDVHVVETLNNLKTYNCNDTYIVGDISDAFKLFLRGCNRIIIWVQGIKPEESFMAEKKYIKKYLLEIVEKYVLKKSLFVIFVSNAMKKHYENKYKVSFRDRYYIIPCFNEDILNKSSFYEPEKYEKNVFTYTGSLLVWQCFEETVDLYGLIEKKTNKHSKLLVLTPDIEKATEIIKSKDIKNYEINYVKQEDLKNKLSEAKFGFIIRQDDAVNRVATPTKLSTYISNGIIPIFSKCILDFAELTKGFEYVIPLDTLDPNENANIVLTMMNKKIDESDVYNEFSTIFENYYNTNKHINNLADKISRVL